MEYLSTLIDSVWKPRETIVLKPKQYATAVDIPLPRRLNVTDIRSLATPIFHGDPYNFKPTMVEKFKGVNGKSTSDQHIDENLLLIINAHKRMLIDYVHTNPRYKPWEQYWLRLVRKRNVDITQVDNNDVGYTINKGMITKLRINDNNSSMNLSVISHVLAHELAHVACPEQGHTPLFNELMGLLMLGCVELKICTLNSPQIQTMYMSNGTPIVSKSIIKQLCLTSLHKQKRDSYVSAMIDYVSKV